MVISFKRFDLFNIGTIKYQVFKSGNWESNLRLTLSCPIFFKSINMMVVFGVGNFEWHHSLYHQPPILFCRRPCRYLTRPVSTTIRRFPTLPWTTTIGDDDDEELLCRLRSCWRRSRTSGGWRYSCCIGGVCDERLRSVRLDDSCYSGHVPCIRARWMTNCYCATRGCRVSLARAFSVLRPRGGSSSRCTRARPTIWYGCLKFCFEIFFAETLRRLRRDVCFRLE